MEHPVGFVGLGIMGRPMARNLAEAGYGLIVYNRTREKAEEFSRETGARAAQAPREVMENSGMVFTMLPGPPEVEEVVAGPRGLLAGARPGSLIVDMSTSSPALARRLITAARERGAAMLDAPVSGGDVGAAEGTLSIMVGGRREDFLRARPLLEKMGRTVVLVGAHGAGQVAKACNQIVVALTIEALSEALVLGSKGGVSPEKLLGALGGGLAANNVMEVKREKFLYRRFEPGGKVKFQHKDLGIALAAGREHGVCLPATALVEQMYGALRAGGRGELDHSALVTLLEECAGHRIDEHVGRPAAQ